MKNTSVKRVRQLLPHRRFRDILFGFLCVATAALTIYEPIVLSDLIDQAADRTAGFQYALVLLAITVYLARSGLTYYKKAFLLQYRNGCILHLSDRMVAHLMKGRMRNFEAWSPSYLVPRVIDEPSNIDGILPCCLLDGVISILICQVIFVLMFLQSWQAAFLTLLFVGADYYIAFRLPLTKVFKACSEILAKLKSRTSNLFQGIRQIKLGDRFATEAEMHHTQTANYLHALYQKNFLSQVQRLSGNTCRQFGYLLIIVVSAVMIASGHLGLGQFTMLLSLYNLLWSHTANAENLIPMYKYGQVTCDRIVEILDSETEPDPQEIPADLPITDISFQEVSFAYRSDHPVLRCVTFQAQRGKITALAGYSGCGKSTVLDLILGFLEPQAGNICIHDRALSWGELVGLRTRVGYVGQNGFLFNRSLCENLLYYVEDNGANRELLDRYLRRFGLNQMVEALPDGLDHILTDQSATISGGEKQRLCIIRELMKKPDILILDECTSHLDAASESEIFAVIRELAADMVIIQVAHRPSALVQSDTICVLEAGRVTACGTHHQLLHESAFYQELLDAMEDKT